MHLKESIKILQNHNILEIIIISFKITISYKKNIKLLNIIQNHIKIYTRKNLLIQKILNTFYQIKDNNLKWNLTSLQNFLTTEDF